MNAIGHQIEIIMPEGLEEIVPGYLANRRQELLELAGFVENADFDRIRFMSHDLKGTGAAYGFPKITECGIRMEEAASIGDLESLRCLVAELADYLSRVQLKEGRL